LVAIKEDRWQKKGWKIIVTEIPNICLVTGPILDIAIKIIKRGK
jgi:hypothetical protein